MTKLRGVRWWMMGLLMVGSIINYLTRSTLAVAAPNVLKDLDITEQEYSWILSGFSVLGGAEVGPGYRNASQLGFFPVCGSGAPQTSSRSRWS